VRRHDRHSRFGLGRGRTTLHRAFYSAFYCVCAAADQRLLSPSLSLPPSPSPLSLTLSLSLSLSVPLSLFSFALSRPLAHISDLPRSSGLLSFLYKEGTTSGAGSWPDIVCRTHSLSLYLPVPLPFSLSLSFGTLYTHTTSVLLAYSPWLFHSFC